MLTNIIMPSEVSLLHRMFNTYNIKIYNSYPFESDKWCFFITKYRNTLDYYHRARSAYFLSFIKYHVLPFDFIAGYLLGKISDAMIEKKNYDDILQIIKDNYL